MLLKKISENAIIRQMQENDLDSVSQIENFIASTPWDKQQFLGCCKAYNAFVVVANNNGNQQYITGIDGSNILGYGIISIYKSN